MKAPHLVLLALSALLSCRATGHAVRSGPPNVVVFLVDDMGWQDTSVPFHTVPTPLNRRFRTPNMERLAARGVKFTQAYAHAICSPTRISLVTGATAARHRVTNWTLRRDASNDRPHERLSFPAWNVNGLSPDAGVPRTFHARPLPDYLREAGYRTIHVGKAHFGAIGTPGADPRNLGFEVNVAGHAAGAPASYYGEHRFSAAGREGKPEGTSVWDVPGLEEYHGQPIHLTDALAEKAVVEVRTAVDEGRPFFLYFAPYAVHAPIMPHPGHAGNYPDLDPTEAAYASMIEGMDAALGRVLDVLDELDVTDETVVLFTSDNGGLSAVARGGEPHTHNRPLSSGKGSAHEGGIRVPMLAAWPGVTAGGTACDTPVVIEDWFATVLEIAGMAPDRRFDGRSFVPLLRGESLPPRELVWHQPNNWIRPRGPGLGPHSTLRSGRWKLVYYHERQGDERFELFDLEEDIGETKNLYAAKTGARYELRRRLGQALRRLDAQMPTDVATGERIPWPDE